MACGLDFMEQLEGESDVTRQFHHGEPGLLLLGGNKDKIAPRVQAFSTFCKPFRSFNVRRAISVL